MENIYNKSNKNPYYVKWKSMKRRCYNKTLHESHPTYEKCTMSEDWLVFNNFADWCKDNYQIGFELDKDILFVNNKHYSKETCCFVPYEINILFVTRNIKYKSLPMGVQKTKEGRYRARIQIDGVHSHIGVYDTPLDAFNAFKVVKERKIKILANKYRKLIKRNVYEALFKWEVLITD